jgi:enoyl-CoA hydratase/carnithine racemase
MSEELVLCEIKDGVAELTLNRPDRMNAWTWDMGLQLHELIRKCGEDDAVRAIIVTGAGRAFCAGADLQRGASTFSGEGRDAQPEQARRARVNPWDIPKPIIAAINGPAVGVGLTTPLQYDIRVAAKDAKLGFVFVQRGVMPELASTWILPRLIGVARACDLLLSGRIFLGEEAAQIGVVNEAVAREEVLPRAREIAARDAARGEGLLPARSGRGLEGGRHGLRPEAAGPVEPRPHDRHAGPPPARVGRDRRLLRGLFGRGLDASRKLGQGPAGEGLRALAIHIRHDLDHGRPRS